MCDPPDSLHFRSNDDRRPGRSPSDREPLIDADILRVPVGPGALHVERYGHGGRPILLLHGFGTCAFLWRQVGPALAIAGYTAYAVDLLGHGESDRPFDAPMTVEAQALYLDRALTALRIARAALAGVDLGATVALRLAADRPERVERIALINPLAYESIPAEDVRTLQRNTARFALRISRGILGAAPLLAPLLEGSVADPARMPMRLQARYLAPFVGREGVAHLLTLTRSVRSEDFEAIPLEAVRAPVLVIRGELDRWVDGDVAKRLVIALLPHARLVELPGVARLVPEDDPERLVELLVDLAPERWGEAAGSTGTAVNAYYVGAEAAGG